MKNPSDKMQDDCPIDYILTELKDLSINLCVMYCPPKTPIIDIQFVFDHARKIVNP
jgi:hypothetical protein